jgi:hypothetical protein
MEPQLDTLYRLDSPAEQGFCPVQIFPLAEALG